jgi:hypothetical protein
MYHTYLATSSHKKDLEKKINITMMEPLAAPLAAWLLQLGRNPRRTMFTIGWLSALSKDFFNYGHWSSK